MSSTLHFLGITLIAVLTLFLGRTPVFAIDDSDIVKDSVYFTMDDGVMTKEEMEQESRYVYSQCARDTSLRIYYHCDCLAGAFLQKREDLGPTIPQGQILNQLLSTKDAQCTNKESIAGSLYSFCINISRFTRQGFPDNEDYCTCSGNKFAYDYAKRPIFFPSYMNSLKVNAYLSCEDPAYRDPFL